MLVVRWPAASTGTAGWKAAQKSQPLHSAFSQSAAFAASVVNLLACVEHQYWHLAIAMSFLALARSSAVGSSLGGE